MLTGSHGISRGDEVHSAWLFDSKVVALWVATEIVTKATTIKKKRKKKENVVCSHTSALGEEKRSIFGLTVFLKDTEIQRKDDEYK